MNTEQKQVVDTKQKSIVKVMPNFENMAFSLLRNLFDSGEVVYNQVASYNNFILFGIQDIINQESTISAKDYTVKFGQVHITTPVIIENNTCSPLYPQDARYRNLTYDAILRVDITEISTVNGKREIKQRNAEEIARIPVMLRSVLCNLRNCYNPEKYGECPKDPGGYFIVKGTERVLTGQFRMAYNKPLVFRSKKVDKYEYTCEMRSMSSETGHSVLIKCLLDTEQNLFFTLPNVKGPIPVGIVFMALGFPLNETVDLIQIPGAYREQFNGYVKKISYQAYSCPDMKSAWEYIGNNSLKPTTSPMSYGHQIVETELLPHLGIVAQPKEIAIVLARMVRRLVLTVYGYRVPDDRDNYQNRRLEVAGVLMYELFRNLYKKYIENIRSYVENRIQIQDIRSYISKSNGANGIITKGLRQALSTGAWGAQKNSSYVRTGVSQVLERITFNATLSHLRRVQIPMGKEGKTAAMRQIHSSQFGLICPCETPEGKGVGVVLNFALLTRVSERAPLALVCKFLEKIELIDSVNVPEHTPVFLNGIFMGSTDDPVELVEILRYKRQKKILPYDLSITYDTHDNEVVMYGDEGRLIRPLFSVNEENKLNIFHYKGKLSWENLVTAGVIVYLDSTEIEYSTVGMTVNDLAVQKCDYVEIHPIVLLGIIASMIPFSDHVQSPRNCFQCSMGKQAIGLPVLTHRIRTDTNLKVLHYPQKPLVFTRMADILGSNDMGSGINCVVAIACYSGYNQEDSVMLNGSSVDRGLFVLTSYSTIDCSEKKVNGTYVRELIQIPPETSPIHVKKEDADYFRRQNANFELLDARGIIRERHSDGRAVYVKKGDVLVGKVQENGAKSGQKTYKDISIVVQAGEEGTIDKVIVRNMPDGLKCVKVVIREIRKPILGDKLASRSAQKGTVGMIYRQEDMPFTSQGIVPDIIMNPLALPSRMTVNQLIECVLGKECCFTGGYGDATPFTEFSTNVAEKIGETLREKGFQPQGMETMYNGMTGEKIKAQIYIGPTYYQRLKHMVQDKIHARARGGCTILTRQPQAGRQKDGGLRLGEVKRLPQCSLIGMLVCQHAGDTTKTGNSKLILIFGPK